MITKKILAAASFILTLLIGLVRYLIPAFPLSDIDSHLVSFRLTILNAITISGFVALVAACRFRDMPSIKKIRVAILTVGLLAAVVYDLAGSSGLWSRQDPSAKGESRYTFSSDWVSLNDKLWTHALSDLRGKPNIRALEIGSFEGRSAIWFLENILTDPNASITCIDTWSGTYASKGNFELTFDRNIQAYGRPNKVIKLKGKSEDLLPGLRQESFDFVYIDGSHHAHDVLARRFVLATR